MSIADKLTTIAENQEKVFEAGKKAEYDAFWDIYQQNGTRTDYANAFGGMGWTNETFKPKYKIQPTTTYMMFRNSKLNGTLEDLCDIDLSKVTNFQYAFSNSTLTEIRSTINCTGGVSTASTFQGCQLLKTIAEWRVDNAVNMNANHLASCIELENLNITGTIGTTGLSVQHSKKLTHDSLMTIINALYDYSGSSGSYKVTLGNDNIAKLTAEELQIIQDKGWTYA